MSVNPVRGVDYPATYQRLLAWFPDDKTCLEYLAGLRWPDGFVCPSCGGRQFWRTGTGLWMCQACERRTSVTAGTIFHRTRTPLSSWFAAIWFLTSQKNGMSALGLQRVLGFASYETAWAWLHKLRRAMVRPERDRLAGIVELDETMIGGVSHGVHGGYGDKVAVMVAVERNERAASGGSGSPSPSTPEPASSYSSRPRSSSRARRSAPTAPARCASWPSWATRTSTRPATTRPTGPACCPACTWSRP